MLQTIADQLQENTHTAVDPIQLIRSIVLRQLIRFANLRIESIFQLLNFRYKFILENNENASFYLGTNSLGEKSRRETKHGNDDIQLRKDQRTEGGRDELSITKYHIKS